MSVPKDVDFEDWLGGRTLEQAVLYRQWAFELRCLASIPIQQRNEAIVERMHFLDHLLIEGHKALRIVFEKEQLA